MHCMTDTHARMLVRTLFIYVRIIRIFVNTNHLEVNQIENTYLTLPSN